MRLLLFVLIFIVYEGNASDSIIISKLLGRIEELQVKQHGAFPKGMIPSYRYYALDNDKAKADDNLFFTALVAMTLKDIKKDLTASQQIIADRIITNVLPIAKKFRNRKNRPTYNFWPTDTVKIFPNSVWLNWFSKISALPDDLDCTVIMLMASQTEDSTAKQVHVLMQSYTNDSNKKVQNAPRKYRDIQAYSTWFGDKWPVDLDVCVLSNVLYFVQSNNLAWTAADSASLQFIKLVIADKKHVSAPASVSPHYIKTSVILYHLSRLMALKTIPALEKFRLQLIEEAQQALLTAETFMDEVILSTALLRWGATPVETKPHSVFNINELLDDENFSFFVANMASFFPAPFKSWMEFTKIGKFNYHCYAYNCLLLAENLIWRKRRGM